MSHGCPIVVPYLTPRLSPWWLSSLSPHRFRSRVVAAVVAMVAVEAVMAVVVVLVVLVVLGVVVLGKRGEA